MRIAFSGKICSGKTTAANIVESMLGCEATTKLSVASRVKELAIDLFGMEQKDRKLLQVLGQKMKEIDPDVWIRALIKQVNDCGDKHIVIDDLRFPNELRALRENGFIIIRLEIDPELQLKRIKETYPDTWESHVSRLDNISETALDRRVQTSCRSAWRSHPELRSASKMPSAAPPYNCENFDYVIHQPDTETIRNYFKDLIAHENKNVRP